MPHRDRGGHRAGPLPRSQPALRRPRWRAQLRRALHLTRPRPGPRAPRRHLGIGIDAGPGVRVGALTDRLAPLGRVVPFSRGGGRGASQRPHRARRSRRTLRPVSGAARARATSAPRSRRGRGPARGALVTVSATWPTSAPSTWSTPGSTRSPPHRGRSTRTAAVHLRLPPRATRGRGAWAHEVLADLTAHTASTGTWSSSLGRGPPGAGGRRLRPPRRDVPRPARRADRLPGERGPPRLGHRLGRPLLGHHSPRRIGPQLPQLPRPTPARSTTPTTCTWPAGAPTGMVGAPRMDELELDAAASLLRKSVDLLAGHRPASRDAAPRRRGQREGRMIHKAM